MITIPEPPVPSLASPPDPVFAVALGVAFVPAPAPPEEPKNPSAKPPEPPP